MAEQAHHCPFLNRADPRCSRHFSLDSLDHAFKYCFDRYKTCPVYLELLVERRLRRQMGAVVRPERSDDNAEPVQITIGGRDSHALSSGVAAASGR
jgi:hypothetical protein